MILDDIILARAADQDFSDLTTARRTGSARWVGPDRLEIPFDRELTAEEAEAIRLRLTTPEPEVENLRAQARRAYQSNQEYLAIATPTAAQVRDQVAALTRQMNGLIRLAADGLKQ